MSLKGGNLLSELGPISYFSACQRKKENNFQNKKLQTIIYLAHISKAMALQSLFLASKKFEG